jgi:hypothetical protein
MANKLAELLGLQPNLNLMPSPQRSQLVQALQQQSMQRPMSQSPVESLNIASKPFLAALLARKEQQGQQNVASRQQAALASLMRTQSQDPAQAEAASRALAIQLGGLPPDNQLAQALMGAQVQQAFSSGSSDPFTLSPGQTRFDASGQPIVSIPNGADVERVGQRVVNGQEMEIFRDKANNQLFTQDAQGNRTPLGSSDLTTPIQRREQGSPGSFANPTARKEFDDFVLGAVQSTRTIDGMLGQLDSADAESVVGIPGFVSRGLSSVTATAKGLADLAGGQAVKDGQIVPENELLNPSNFDFSAFGDRAERGATFKSDMIQLAYSQARVFDPGGRLSDFDVQVQLDRLASGSGDPRQMRAALVNIRNQIGQSVNDRATFFGATDRVTPEFQQLFQNAPTSTRFEFVSPSDINAMDGEAFQGFVNGLTDQQLRDLPEDVLRSISQRMQ